MCSGVFKREAKLTSGVKLSFSGLSENEEQAERGGEGLKNFVEAPQCKGMQSDCSDNDQL